MVTYEQLDAIADSVNPILAVLTLIIPWVIVSAPQRPRLSFYLASLLSMASMYLLEWIDNTLRIWPRFGLDYSGHTGFSSVLLCSMVFWNRRLLVPSIVVFTSYAVLMIYQKYHTVLDIITTLVVILPITVAFHVAAARAFPRRQQLTTVQQQ